MKVWLLGILVIFACSGCSVLEQSEERGVEYRLRQAGFKAVAASPEELSRLTPFRMEGKMREGRIIYRYADPDRGRIYEGGPQEYARYREIAISTQERRVTNLAQIGPRRTTGPLLW